MYKNLKWIRLVPDSPGKGGSKTGFHSFQVQPMNDTRRTEGFHVYRGRWRRDYQSRAIVPIWPDVGAYTVKALHAYTYPNLTDPSAAPSLTVLGHHVGGGFARYWDFSNGAAGTLRDSHSAQCVPATFLNIEGRCFVADGAREGMILDDRTAAIHTQANQNLGIGTPTQALTGNYAGNITAVGTGYIHNGSPYINHPNPNNRLATIVSTDEVTPIKIDAWTAAYDAGAVMAAGAPTVDAVTSNTTPFTATGTIAIDPAVDKSLITLTGWTWPVDFQYCGLSINFNGYSFVILETGPAVGGITQWDVDGVPWAGATNVQLRILGKYDGPAVSGIPYTITGCQVTMGANSTLNTVNSAVASQGYSQSTASALVQVHVAVTQDGGTGAWRNLGNISLGPESPDGAATGSIESITDGSMTGVPPRKLLTSASNPWAAEDVGLSIFVDEADSSGGILTTTIATFLSAGSVRLAAANESGVDIAGTGQAWWGSDAVVSDGAMGATPDQTLTSASNPFTSGDVGQPIVVEGAGNAGGTIALITTIASFTSAGSVELTDPNLAGAITGKRVWFRGVSVDTHAGPTYAYAWYDPETGHMSNISPKFQIPRPTEIGNYVDFAYVTPVFQIDPGAISYPTTTDGIRFSHIMFFRTLSNPNSSTLYPIGSVMPYVGKVNPGSASTRGSWNPSTFHGWMGLPNNYTAAPPEVAAPQYWYDFSSDEDLLLAGGFRAPQYTNSKPMALLRGGITEPAKVAYQAYWDRRLWAVATQEPDKIMFSCDEAQCPLGVPVESFPPTNYLRIPSVDGQVVGMKTVGDMLLVTTHRWAYTIAGNNESNYRLLRISTRMGGVGVYQMDELTSDVEGQQSIVYFLGRDKIVYEWVPGGAVKPISDPIQDVLNERINSLTAYERSRVHCVSAWARRLVVVTFRPLPGGGNDFLVFDVQNRVWTKNYADDGAQQQGGTTTILTPPEAMTTVYGKDPPVNEIFSSMNALGSQVIVKSWIRDDGWVQLTPFGFIYTFPLDFDGIKKRKQLCMINIHVSASTVPGNWVTNVATNESNSQYAAFGIYEDPAYSVYGPTSPAPVDSTTAADLVVLTAAFTAADPTIPNYPLVGYRFSINIGTAEHAAPTELWAIDIGYVDWAEPGEADP